MPAPSRIARGICSARPSRLALLAGAVALSVVLMTTVACALASLNGAFKAQIDSQIGAAQARLRPAKGDTLDAQILDRVRGWEGVESALPRLQSTLSLVIRLDTMMPVDRADPGGAYEAIAMRYATNAFVNGIDPGVEFTQRPIELLDGRYPRALDEIVIDLRVAQRLSWAGQERSKDPAKVNLLADPGAYLKRGAPSMGMETGDPDEARTLNLGVGVRIGSTLTVPRFFGRARTLTVVGLARPAPLGGKPIAFTTIGTLDALSREPGRLTDIELALDDSIDPEAFVALHESELLPGVMLQTTGRITSGVEQNMQASQLGFILISVISLISSAFIIMTGLTTGVAEQQRTLAVLRALGATRAQLALAQLLVGAVVAGLGVLLGAPLGIALSYALSRVFEQQMTRGLVVPLFSLTLMIVGAIGAGLLGALWPAIRAASLSPIRAMTQRASAPGALGIVLAAICGCLGIASMLAIVLLLGQRDSFFWIYAGLGLPLMFIGYFLVSVPLVLLVSRLLARWVSLLLRLPVGLLGRTVDATPYRHGFTAGALMTGLALMIGIWTNGSSAMRDWLGKIRFPDAFAYGLPLSPEAQGILESLPFVESTCAIAMHPVKTDAFGVKGLSSYKTNFIGFEPRTFFDMASLEFVEGDLDTARTRLIEGDTVLVAREFQVARGLGVGDAFVCMDADDKAHEFEIVGVVTSPGLELVSQYFDLGDNFINQAISSVFGSRQTLIDHFGFTSAQLIQVDLDDAMVDEMGSETALSGDEQAVQEMRQALLGAGVLNVGSGRMIRQQILAVFASTLVVFSTVAVGAMLVACFGVANLIVAEVSARRFELGVLRAVGASRSQLVRLICGQALLIALTACVLGTALGLQAAWGGQEMNRRVVGIDLSMSLRSIPLRAIALAWTIAIILSLLAAAPSALKLGRSSIRTLLSRA